MTVGAYDVNVNPRVRLNPALASGSGRRRRFRGPALALPPPCFSVEKKAWGVAFPDTAIDTISGNPPLARARVISPVGATCFFVV